MKDFQLFTETAQARFPGIGPRHLAKELSESCMGIRFLQPLHAL